MSKPIKLDDKIIKEHISDWSYETKDDQGNTIIKQKGNRSYTPFDVDKNSRLKGFNLCERKDKKGNRTDNDFCVHYKFNAASKYHMFGRFKPGIYGIKQAQDDLIEISKKHTDEDLKWVRDPNITKKEKKTKEIIADQILIGSPYVRGHKLTTKKTMKKTLPKFRFEPIFIFEFPIIFNQFSRFMILAILSL